MRWIQSAGWLAAAALLAPAARAALPADVVGQFGGIYATDCARPDAPRLRITADALTVEQGGRRLSGGQTQAAYAYFGNSPPPGYQVALLGEAPGKTSLVFIVSHDRTGQFINVEADRQVASLLGASATARFRSCDADHNARAAREYGQANAPKSPSGPIAAEAASSPPELLRNAELKALYLKALGPKAKERWLARLEGPAPALKKHKLQSVEYTVASACQPHDCGDNNLVLLYAPAQGQLYGKIYELNGGTTWLGDPPPVVKAEIEKLWRAEWRSR
ncbi:MAG: Ivy family c-type lysozyme inhibitor [Burkholderiales bacterium]|nr:Ivy family c-type lysozyme inhibitor [Burkholderiales bacterium]